MRKKMFRKVTAIMMAAAMMSSGYTMVSADDFTDQEVQTEAAVEDIAVESTEEAVAEEIQEIQEADVQIEEEAPAEESESAEVTFEDETTDAFSDGTDAADFAEAEVEAEVEVTSYRTDFCFENEEVVITASVSEDAELPENAEMKAEKLEAGSEKYEEAKQASMRDLGTSEDAEYTFYDVTFTVDGNEVELSEGAAVINMEFKDGEVQENETQSALHIAQTEEGTVAQDVTAQTEDGSLKSVDINF